MKTKQKQLWLRNRAEAVINEKIVGKRAGKMGQSGLAKVHNVLPKGTIAIFEKAFQREANACDGSISRNSK